jgi:hypothetical protein
MTPPKADGAANPTSSVMIRRIFGAPFGGTTVVGQAGFDWAASSFISPWNFCGGGGDSGRRLWWWRRVNPGHLWSAEPMSKRN